MILSQSEEAVGHWWSSEGDIGEPRHHRGEIVAPIEAVFEFGEVAGHMLVTDGTVGASDGALDVSEGRVDRIHPARAAAADASCWSVRNCGWFFLCESNLGSVALVRDTAEGIFDRQLVKD